MLGSNINVGNTSSLGPVAGKKPKVALKPGRSLMDWIRLGASGKDLQGFGGHLRTVSMEELAKHNTENDCWMLLRGKVYNISDYTGYHPGGIPELMRAAGKDGTAFFDEVHKWVNAESMLAKCLIGPIDDKRHVKEIKFEHVITAPSSLSLNKQDIAKRVNTPRFEWYQNEENIIVSIYTKRPEVTLDDLIVDCADGKNFNCKILLGEKYYQICIALENEISSVKVKEPTNASGKFELRLVKTVSSVKWNSLGEKLVGNNEMLDEKDRELVYRNCVLCGIEQITKDTKLFTIELPDRVHYRAPIGHHVLIEAEVQGMKISRNYTVALGTLEEERGFPEDCNSRLNFLLKIYNDGALTPALGGLKIGDSISISDCTGDFKLARLIKAKSVCMIAAGTGLTPMIRLMNYIIKDKDRPRKASLLFANRNESDILWKEELSKAQEMHKDVLKVDYVLSRPPSDWQGISGRMNKDILSEFFSNVERPVIGEELLIGVCGPTDFTSAIKGFLIDMEFTESMIHCFLE